MELLRERIKGLEHKIVEMIRHGQESMSITDRLFRWVRVLMTTQDPMQLPTVLLDTLVEEFLVPQAALRVWEVAGAPADAAWAQPVGGDLRSFATSLNLPYCGPNGGFEAAEAAVIAREIKRPVKMIWTREEDLVQGHFRPQSFQCLEAALDSTGKVAGWIAPPGRSIDHQPIDFAYVKFH